MNQKTINIVAATLIVVAIGVAVKISSEISGAVREVAEVIAETPLRGTTNLDALALNDPLYASSTVLVTGQATFYSATTTYGTANSPTYQTVGGINFGIDRNNAAASTTRLCSNLNPLNASSTGQFIFNFPTATSSAATVSIATTTSNASATTSLNALRTYTIGANTKGTIVYDFASVATVGTSLVPLGPTDQVTVYLTNGTSVDYAYTYTSATCDLYVRQVN